MYERRKTDDRAPALNLGVALRQRWWVILLVFAVVTGTVAFVAHVTPPTFLAKSSLMIRVGREFIYRPEVGSSQTARTLSIGEMVNSEIEILGSRDLANQVVSEIGVERLYPALLEEAADVQVAFERAVHRFRGAVYPSGVLDSSIIKVSFEHPDRHLAAEAVNLLVDRFMDKHVEVFSDTRSDFLESRLELYEQKLAEAEDALRTFKQEHGVYDLATQKSLLLAQHRELDTELNARLFRIAELKGEIAATKGYQDGEAGEVPPVTNRLLEQKQLLMAQLNQLEIALNDAEVDALQVQDVHIRLLDLKLEESEARRNFREDSRQVESIRRDIEMVQEFLEGVRQREALLGTAQRDALQERVERLTGEIHALDREELRRELAALETRRGEIQAELDDLDDVIRTLDGHEVTLRRLERAVARMEATVATYVQKVDEARIHEELDNAKRTSVRVIERAAPPIEPSGLSPKMKTALGGLIGLLAGTAAALFLALLRP